jgi:hypothetical protein
LPAPTSTGGQATPASLGETDPCEVLTSDEIAGVFGEETSDPERKSAPPGCWWYFGAGGADTLEVYLYSAADPIGSYSVWQQSFQLRTDVVQLTVAGHPAMFKPAGDTNATFIVQTSGGGALSIQVSGPAPSGDLQQSFTDLAQLAIARLG